ncbi:MAG TPA: DUF3048 domain-containing protein [Acidimicrobiales bacterium]|nr:DUF3048 domain-containing protein [Acidimicrobiales bacterium]
MKLDTSFSRRDVGLGLVVLATAAVLAGLLTIQSGQAGQKQVTSAPTTSTIVPPTTTSTLPAPVTAPSLAANRCPLTDLPVKQGVPHRPALAIKIGNEPFGARPQSGLNEADIVFDTPAEGFIMRYVAVFQCNNAASIGPIRSVRWVDWHLVREFRNPILTFAGGINPNVDQVYAFKWLSAANLLGPAGVAGVRISSRSPPDNLYTSTFALYGLFRNQKTPPRPVFWYSKRMPRGSRPARSLSIDFSYGTDVVWEWDGSRHAWLHTYGGAPDIDTLTGKPVTARNVIVIRVDYRFGPYVESTGGSGDVESETLGRGSGYVLRNGRSIKVTWHRRFVVDPFRFLNGAHQRVTLTPGRTWVEIVPKGTPMSFGT